jgi:hypothetical protein
MKQMNRIYLFTNKKFQHTTNTLNTVDLNEIILLLFSIILIVISLENIDELVDGIFLADDGNHLLMSIYNLQVHLYNKVSLKKIKD